MQTQTPRQTAFTLAITLPKNLTVNQLTQLASNIIESAKDCTITADTKGINQGIAEQLQHQYPAVVLKPLSL